MNSNWSFVVAKWFFQLNRMLDYWEHPIGWWCQLLFDIQTQNFKNCLKQFRLKSTNCIFIVFFTSNIKPWKLFPFRLKFVAIVNCTDTCIINIVNKLFSYFEVLLKIIKYVAKLHSKWSETKIYYFSTFFSENKCGIVQYVKVSRRTERCEIQWKPLNFPCLAIWIKLWNQWIIYVVL